MSVEPRWLGGVLTGNEILRQVEQQNIKIDPWCDAQVNPASYDLRLGDKCLVYNRTGDIRNPFNYEFLDSKIEHQVVCFQIPESGLILEPSQLYILHTQEVVWSDCYVSVVDGKSSIGRLGIQVHSTAGYIDPGFKGQITLEVSCVQRVRIYAGMRFCQIRYMTLEGRITSYQEKGNYIGEASMGPVPSRSWKQFEDG